MPARRKRARRRHHRHHVPAVVHHRHHRRRRHAISDSPFRRARKRVSAEKVTLKKAAIAGAVATVIGGAYPVAMKGIERLVKNRLFAGLTYVGIVMLGGVIMAKSKYRYAALSAISAGISTYASDMTVYFDLAAKAGLSDYFADYFADPVHPSQLGAPSQTMLPIVRLGDIHNARLGDVARQSHSYAMNDNDGGHGYGGNYGVM
jgi:hypothetical protein